MLTHALLTVVVGVVLSQAASVVAAVYLHRALSHRALVLRPTGYGGRHGLTSRRSRASRPHGGNIDATAKLLGCAVRCPAVESAPPMIPRVAIRRVGSRGDTVATCRGQRARHQRTSPARRCARRVVTRYTLAPLRRTRCDPESSSDRPLHPLPQNRATRPLRATSWSATTQLRRQGNGRARHRARQARYESRAGHLLPRAPRVPGSSLLG